LGASLTEPRAKVPRLVVFEGDAAKLTEWLSLRSTS
jgi:hypothetical protein